MSEVSSSNRRVVDVLNFLAAHPSEVFTLREIADQLGLSNGSAHRVLSMLTEARYLYRHPKHKTYSLGMALVALGQAAMEKHRGIEIARREIAQLAGDLRAQCILSTTVEGETLLLAKAGVPQSDDGLYRVGERLPCIPPLNLTQIAWADSATLDVYLNKARSLLAPSMLLYLKRAINLVRHQGYAIAAKGEALRELSQSVFLTLEERAPQPTGRRVAELIGSLSKNEILLVDLEETEGEGVAYITAPVVSPGGAVAFDLTLTGLPHALSVREIETYVNRLRAAAAVVAMETYRRASALA